VGCGGDRSKKKGKKNNSNQKLRSVTHSQSKYYQEDTKAMLSSMKNEVSSISNGNDCSRVQSNWMDALLLAAVMAHKSENPAVSSSKHKTETTSQRKNVTMAVDANNVKTIPHNVPPISPVEVLSVVESMNVIEPKEARSRSSSVQKKTYTRNPRKICSALGCNKFARFNNACSGHGGRRLCSAVGCERVAQFGQKCNAHGGIKPCDVEGCNRAVQSRGKCKTHGGGVRCQFPSCEKGAISKGHCRAHGGGARCSVEGCTKWAQRHGCCVRHSKKMEETPLFSPSFPSTQFHSSLGTKAA
jgi:hypothetical protein